MTTDSVAQDSKAKDVRPYVPWRTFFNLLDRMAEEGAPPRVDRTYIKNLDGSAQAQVMATLKWAEGIAEDGTVQPALAAFIGPNRKQAVGKLVREKYPEAVALGEQNATQGQLDEAFRAYGFSGDTLRRAESFFLNAADYAGIKLSRNFKKPRSAAAGAKPTGDAAPARKRTATSARRPANKGRRTTGGGGDGETSAVNPQPTGDSRFITLSDGKTTLSLNLSAGVLSLPLADLKWVLSVLEMFDTYASASAATKPAPEREAPARGYE